MMWHGQWSGADWVVMALVMVVFWAAVVGFVLWLVAGSHVSGRPEVPTPAPPRPDSSTLAREVLDARLARGELSVEEYEIRRDLLTPR